MSNKTETKTTTDVDSEVVELGQKIAKGIKIVTAENDSSLGLVIAKEDTKLEDLYISNLPEGITKDTVKKIQDHNSLFAAASTYGVGLQVIDFLKQNEGVKKVEFSAPMVGKDSFEASFNRHSEYPKVGGDAGEKISKYCTVTTGFEIQGTRNVGDMKKVRLALGELGAAALASK